MATESRFLVGDESDFLENGEEVITEIKGIEIGIYRVDDEYYAIANYCPHQSGPLCEGELTESVVTGDDYWSLEFDNEGFVAACPWHGWQFDIRNGESLQTDRVSTPSFDVEVENGEVFVVLSN